MAKKFETREWTEYEGEGGYRPVNMREAKCESCKLVLTLPVLDWDVHKRGCKGRPKKTKLSFYAIR